MSKSQEQRVLFYFCLATVLSFIACVQAQKPLILPRCAERENEFYSCGSACQTECRTLGEACPIVNIRCNDDCYCIEGYARDDYGKCIPISKCPKYCKN